MKTKYLSVSLAVFALFFAFKANAGIFQFSETDPKYLQALSIAAAQEAQEEVDIKKQLELDEDLKPEDFGLTDVGILPTNPFYFIKGIRRGVGSVFTRDPAKKAELKLKYAAEKLLEAKEVAQQDDASVDDKEYAIENFKDELEEVKHRVEIASESVEGDKAKELSKKVLDATLKYSKSLGNIEKNVSSELFDHVKGAKDAASEALVSTFELTEPEVVSNQLTEVLNEQKGSEFKNFKNLEVLKEVEAKVPQEARNAIKNAQENALNRLQAELEKFEAGKKAIFEEFVKESGGSEIRHLEIINDLEARPISKDLRDVILGAKEHVFSKAEIRLNGLSQENKEKFVEHLGEGNLEDFRILKELQNNIDSGVISGISNVASRAKTEFIKKIESTGQDEAQRKEFLGSIERFHDAKSISVLNEIEKLIPDDKKSFFAELKSKAVSEIRNDVSRAANSSQRQFVYNSLAGDHPEDIAALDKFQGTVQTPFDISAFISGIKRAQYGAMQDKIENISDKERLAKYEEEFKKLGQEIPDYFTFRKVFRDRKDIFESPEKALKKIEEAEKAIAEFRGVRSSLPYDSAYKGGEFDQMLRDIEGILAHAERKLETARTVLGYNDIGRAFGEAQSAENIAKDGIALATKYKSGVKETRCPFYYPQSSNFCTNGVVVHQTDQNGCPLPPRCEFKEIRECPTINYSTQPSCPAGTHRESNKDEKGCYVLGKCVPDRVTCQAYFEGYIFDKFSNSCRKEGSGGCSDPFVYHTLDECTKAHTTNKVNVCPLVPTVLSCPTGEHKVVTFSSPECGTYYSCEKDITIATPQCSDGKDNDGDGLIDYPADTGCYGKEDYDEAYYPPAEPYCRSYATETTCKNSVSGCVWYTNHHDGTHCDDVKHGSTVSTQNWIEHFWKFKDGLTERSMILNRTDNDYLTFISGIEKQCLGITKDKFVWKPGAGNDDPANWQNFGIPDCTGTTVTNYVCGNKICDPGESYALCPTDCGPTGPSCGSHTTTSTCEANPACDWLGSSCVPTTTTMTCNNNKICEYNESQVSCPSDCTSTTARCTYFTEATCNADAICAWVSGFGCGSKAQCNDKVDNDGDGLIDMADGGCSDNFDNDESGGGISTTKPQCSDGKDNDGDGLIDYPADTGCYGIYDNDEAMVGTVSCMSYTSQTSCQSGGCTWIATYCAPTTTTTCPSGQYWSGTACLANTTTGCGSYTSSTICESYPACDWIATYCAPTTTTTTTLLYEDSASLCSDGIDNDKDGFIDKADPSCSAYTTTGTTQCSDGKDNDGDGLIDLSDGGCYGSADNDETMPTTTTLLYEDSASLCSDGIDNDKDGFIDKADPSCSAYTTTGTTQCSDGKDNDGDGLIDLSDGGCYGSADNDETMPTTTTTCITATTCIDSVQCGTAGFYWYNGICNISPQTTTCITATTCIDSVQCGTAGFYWYNGICNISPQTTTSCVTCSSPGSGCWYEGGSCSTCGTIKCPTTTTTTTACNNNNVCESGESMGSCPTDCH